MRTSDLEMLESATRAAGETESAWAERMLVASAGAVLGDSRMGARVEVPTLALRSRAGGSCVHFVNERCAIYSARPSGCRDFDCGQTQAEADRLGLPMHLDRLRSAQDPRSRYFKLWRALYAQGRTRSREDLNQRRARLEGAGLDATVRAEGAPEPAP